MQPTESFWGGVGQAIGASPGWMVVAATTAICIVVGVVWLWARHIRPSKERVEMRELEIREHEAQNDAERIKVNAAIAEEMSALRISNERMASQNSELLGRLGESAARSREMGGDVRHIKETADHVAESTDKTARQVEDIHRAIVRKEDQ